MIRFYRLIKWVKNQRKKGFYSFNVVTNESTFIIWNPQNDETLRIKY